jgi:hypothetical protein
MTNEQQRPLSTSSAIALMTAWLETPDGPPDLLLDCLSSDLDGHSSEERLSHAVALIMGFTYLNGTLLVMLEEVTGIPAHEMLRNLALQYAQD